MKKSKGALIGIDLGATKIAAALVKPDGQVLADRQLPTGPIGEPEVIFDKIAGLANELAAMCGGEVQGIGIGSPGLVDPDSGTVRGAANLGWEEVRLVAEVQRRLSGDHPVYIGNDADSSALGEHYFGAARGCEHFVYLGIGSGLGSGIMTHGVLVTGANHSAADLGHLSLDPQGLPCTCGLRGCAETVVSGRGLVNLVRTFLAEGRYSTSLPASGELTTRMILGATQKGDELAKAALAEMGHKLGIVMSICVSLLNPAIIIVGGGLGLAAFDWLTPAAWQEVLLRTLPACHQGVKIIPSQLSTSAIGAACFVLYYQRGGEAENSTH